MRPSRALLLGGLTVGTLDILDAIIFFGVRNHVAPIRIFQSIAAGLLGRAAFSGGWRTAVLGGVLHFFIAFMIVGTFMVLSRYVPVLVRRPFFFGILYGIGVYAFMNLVVLPLSNAGRGAFVWPVVANGILIHMLGVGVPAALFASLARRAGAGIREPGSVARNP